MLDGSNSGIETKTIVIFLPSLAQDEVDEMREFCSVVVCRSFAHLLEVWKRSDVVGAVVNCEAPGISQRVNELARIPDASDRCVLRIGTLEVEGFGTPCGRFTFIDLLREHFS